MPMYNLIEYCSNYSEATGSLWFCSKDETSSFNANIANTDNFKSFKYKTKSISNFWRSPEMLLINCKVKLKRKWKNHCLEPANGNDNDDTHPNNHIFTMKDFLAKDLTE